MATNELTEVCRLCASISTLAGDLLDVFEPGKNLKELIFVSTGIEILDSDLVSKKICKQCCQKASDMYQFRQDAHKQDKILKEKQLVGSSTTLQQNDDQHVRQLQKRKSKAITHIASLHPSVVNIYKSNPMLKIPKKCLHMDWSPKVELNKGDVERYISDPDSTISQVSKSTAQRKLKTVTPLKISKSLLGTYSVQKTSAARKRLSSPPQSPAKKVKTQASKSASSHTSVVPNDDSEIKEVRSEASMTDRPTSRTTTELDSMESFRVTRAMTNLPPEPLFKCYICGSLHYNSFQLNRHALTHKICQFCKLQLRDWGRKQDHVLFECRVRMMMMNPGLVALEKIDLNLAIRNQYKEAFLDFEPLTEPEISTPIDPVINLISDDEPELPPVPVPAVPSKYGETAEKPDEEMSCWSNCPVVCNRTKTPDSVGLNEIAPRPVDGNEVIVIEDEPEEPLNLRLFTSGPTPPVSLLQKKSTVVPPFSIPENEVPMNQNTTLGNRFQRKTKVSALNRHIFTPLDMTHRRLLAKELKKPGTDDPTLSFSK